MKLRNFANKFLIITILVIFVISNLTFGSVPVALYLTPTEDSQTQLTKTYSFDELNENVPTGESLYEALGITVYNDYLSALSATQNLKEVIIAVVDTGIDDSWDIFDDRILTEYAMDFSQDLPTEINNKWNIDENGHGTHVAGIIADITLSNVKILPLKIFHGVNNASSDYAFLNAMRYLCALKTGEQVSLLNNLGYESKTNNLYFNTEKVKLNNIIAVNLSLGSTGFNVDSRSDMVEFKNEKYGYTKGGVTYTGYQSIIDNLLKNDILPIVAAGNRASGEYNNQAYYSLPGACDGVLEVSAYDNTDHQYTLASYSYYNDYVSVAAPGTKIWSACSSSILSKSYKELADNDFGDDYSYYEYKSGTTTWYVMKDESGNYYLRESGTSMATPFVSACYAMLMSDPSKVEAADYGLQTWNPENSDKDFMTIAHKALLAAAATDGVHAEQGYEERFGYGTIAVDGFVPDVETHAVRLLNNINYEVQPSTTYQNAKWDDMTISVVNDSVDWFSVCVVLAVGAIFVWIINSVKAYFRAFTQRRETDDDEQ